MAVLERYRSFDGINFLLKEVDGDWIAGFEDFPWHTHGDILYAWGYRGTPSEAARAFVDDILQSRRPFVIWRVNGDIRDFDVPYELDLEELKEDCAKYGVPGETFEARYWNGQPAER